MFRNTLGPAAALIVVTVGLATILACSSDNSAGVAGNGTLAVQLTDAPFSTDSVQSVNVFVVRVDGRQIDSDTSTMSPAQPDDSAHSAGWTTLAEPNASINLLAYQNGQALSLGQGSLAAGTYNGFRLVIDPSQSNITLKSGLVLTATSSPSATFPSGSRSGLKVVLTTPVTVAANATTTLLLDFNVANSFVVRGSSITQGGLLFKPVIQATVK